MPLPTEPVSGRDATYEVDCQCGFEGEVEGEDLDASKWTTIFQWTCPTCDTFHELELDHWDGPYD